MFYTTNQMKLNIVEIKNVFKILWMIIHIVMKMLLNCYKDNKLKVTPNKSNLFISSKNYRIIQHTLDEQVHM